MAYGFKFKTGSSGQITEVSSDDVAPGFLVPSVATVTATVTRVDPYYENGFFVATLIAFNLQADAGAFQPGLQNGHLNPEYGVTISGPGLPAGTRIIGHADMRPQTTTPYQNSATFMLDTLPNGPISTVPDAYTITIPKRDYQYIGHPNDFILRTSADLYNIQCQRPLPDTILDFSDSPFNRHDIITFGPPMFTGGEVVNFAFSADYWNRAARMAPAFYVDQVAKKAYFNYFKNWQNLASPMTVSGSTGQFSTTVTLASNFEFPIQQEMRVFGPNCGIFGIRVTRALTTYTQFTVEAPPVGGWQYGSGLYVLTSGASTYDRIGFYGGSTNGSYGTYPSALCYWKVAVIGRMIT